MSKCANYSTHVFITLSIILCFTFFSSISFIYAETNSNPQTTQAILDWNHNSPTPDGYKIYQRAEGNSYDYNNPVVTTPNNTVTVNDLNFDTTYYFIVRPYLGTQEGVDSNEVSFMTSSTSPSHTISASATGNGSISPSGAVTVAEGNGKTFVISPNTGSYVVDVLVDGVSIGAVSTYTFTQVTQNHTISAEFSSSTYSISASAGPGGQISPSGTTNVSHGGSQSYSITPDEGYQISDIVIDGMSIGAYPAYEFDYVTANHTISVTFAASSTYSISASAATGGQISPAGITNVSHSGSQSYSISPYDGFQISNVIVDGVSIGAVSAHEFTQVTQNHTISAEFSSSTYSISASAGSGGQISPSGITNVSHSGSQRYSISPYDGFQISDVVVDGVSIGTYSAYEFANVTANHTISATFASSTYSISASTGSGGQISPSGTTNVSHGGSQSYSITPDEGYQISDIVIDGMSIGAYPGYEFDYVTANHTISATFTASSTYSISASATSGGQISPSGTTNVSHGGSQSYSITPDNGYQINDVTVDGVSMGPITNYSFDMVIENHTIQATFSPDAYIVSSSADSNGTITPSGNTSVLFGNSQTYTITPDNDCAIADVIVDGVSMGIIESYTFYDVQSDHTISAIFVAENQSPSADSGPDQTVDEGQIVTLNGYNSFDNDDGIAAFQWRQIQGAEVFLSSPTEPQTSFTAPDVDASGTALVFELVVTDYNGATSVDSCIVNVTWVNLPPKADAGTNQAVNEGSQVFLDASHSTDSDDGVSFYTWKQLLGPTVILSDPNSATPTFNAPDVGSEGAAITFEVTVTDAGGLQDTDTCLINVTWVNTPPVADAGSDQSAAIGSEVFLNGLQSYDEDGMTITSFQWRQTEGTPIEMSDATAQNPSFVVPAEAEEGSSLTFVLTVTDNGGLQGTDSCHVHVKSSARKMFVSKISMEMVNKYSYYYARAYVTISDNNGRIVEQANVSGNWTFNGDYIEGASATTNEDGIARFDSERIRAEPGSIFTLKITGIEKDGYSYDPEDNVATQKSISVPEKKRRFPRFWYWR